MIITKFNQYVEKHGRVTYIILGIIICFMFVIFVTPESSGGCGRGLGGGTVMKMFGKKINAAEYQKMRLYADLSALLRYNVQLSRLNESYLRQETEQRIRLTMAAKQERVYKTVTDLDVAREIQQLSFLKDEKGNFDLKAFENFKMNFLRSYGMTARDFDEMIRQNLAMERLLELKSGAVTVTAAELDQEMTEAQVAIAEIPVDEAAAKVAEGANLEKNALAWFAKEIGPYVALAPSTRSSWELGQQTAMKIQNDFNRSDAEKGYELVEYMETLKNVVFPFYLAPKRAGSVAIFSAKDYEKNVTVTDAQVRKVYDEKDDEYKKKNPNFDAVKAQIAAELKHHEALHAAKDAAKVLAGQLRTLWAQKEQKLAEGETLAGLLKRNAAALKAEDGVAKIPVVEDGALMEMQGTKTGAFVDYALTSALFALEEKQPFSDAVEGTDAAYVVVLTKSEAAAMAKAEEHKDLVQQLYCAAQAKAAAEKKATAEMKRINEALTAGKKWEETVGALAFQNEQKKVTRDALQKGEVVSQLKNTALLLADIAAVQDKGLLKRVYATERGVALVYVVSKSVKQDEKARTALADQLKAQKQQQARQQYLNELYARSQTVDLMKE